MFTLDNTKATVQNFLKEILYIGEKELRFLRKFKTGYYRPEMLFDDECTLNRISNHLMANGKLIRFVTKVQDDTHKNFSVILRDNRDVNDTAYVKLIIYIHRFRDFNSQL